MIVPDDPGRWPRIGDLDATVVRLEICRHLLLPLGEQVTEAHTTPAAFEEIGAFLSAWTEERVLTDASGFCMDTVRMLGTLLSHLERDDQLSRSIPPLGISIA